MKGEEIRLRKTGEMPALFRWPGTLDVDDREPIIQEQLGNWLGFWSQTVLREYKLHGKTNSLSMFL